MTIVVGYLAGKVGPSALHLAVRVARMHKTSLTVATIVRRHWPTPSLARVDAEYELWSEQLAAASAREAQRYLRRLADGIEVSYHHRAHRSVSAGLLDVVEELEAEVLVLGSFPSGRRARVLIGSTAVTISTRLEDGSGELCDSVISTELDWVCFCMVLISFLAVTINIAILLRYNVLVAM